MRLRLTWLAALAAATFASACDGGPSDPGGERPDEYDLTWLRQSAVTFRTAEPGGDYADLMPLKQIIGNARVVALGEATHGTREFFQMKHRLLEFLVREMGFNTFGIEATWAESNRIDDYVRGAPGDPVVLLSRTYFWTWRTQEVVDMIEWMRRHNQNPGGAPKVGFYGFDMQYSRVAMDDVEAYLGRVDAAARDSVRTHYTCYRQYQESATGGNPGYASVAATERAQCRAGVQAAHALLERNRARYLGASAAADYERALRAARIVVQNEDTRSYASSSEGSLARDRYMAENASWLLDQAGPGAKMVLWAHNYHVSAVAGAMGAHLRARYAGDYLIAGFSFHKGWFTAVEQTGTGGFAGLNALQAPPAPEGSYEHQFHRLGHPRFLVDIRPVRGSAPASAAWLRGPLPFRSIGAAYYPAFPDRYFAPTQLPALYDVIIHFEDTAASLVLPFRP